ncbi:hypothetical protein OsJ_01627 [Oryza sativa Japonica Group]|uniref:Uncharacterized protein n=1 Tax=Oryza sativa subsp. japonica TaxID=39947 RepID=B9EW95_ORYSJ|nr:hypothetical protein OsJ_01627 [Oryza sativa Japonica Group]
MAVLADSAARKLLHGASAQGVAAGMSLGLDGLLQLVADLFASLVHLFVLPFRAMGHAIQWFFAGVVAGLGGAARVLVLPLETLSRWLQAAVAGIASAAHLLVLPFEAFWRWLRDAAAAALPYVLAIVAVVCVVAPLWLSCTFLCSAAALIGPPLAGAAISCGAFLLPAAVRTGQALLRRLLRRQGCRRGARLGAPPLRAVLRRPRHHEGPRRRRHGDLAGSVRIAPAALLPS